MKSVDVEVGYSFERVTTRAEIQKVITEGMVYIKKRFGDNCTIGDLVKRIDKLERRMNIGVQIPFYCFYAMIETVKLKKERDLLVDLVSMHEFAYNCDFDFIEFDSKYRPKFEQFGTEKLTIKEMMNQKVDLTKFLEGDFDKEYGLALLTKQGFSKFTMEDYIELEEKARVIETQRTEEKNTKKVGRR